MKGEKPKSVRQEWCEFSDEVQEHINETLYSLQADIEFANDRLENALNTDPESVGVLARDIVDALDKQWGYMGDYFFITGKWHYPTEYMVGDNGVLCNTEKIDAFNIAQSNGFMVAPLQKGDSEIPIIGLSFIVGNQYFSGSKMQGRLQLLDFAQPDEVSIRFMRPNTHESVGASIDDVSSAINKAEALLKAYLNHKNSSFFRATAAKQGEFLQSITDTASESLPPADSLDRITLRDISPTILYIKDPKSNKTYSIQAGDGVSMQIEHGVILGFTTIDIINDGIGLKKYDTPQQMNAYYNGLCAVVSPTSCNFDLKEYNYPDLIIPLRLLQENPTIYLESPFAED